LPVAEKMWMLDKWRDTEAIAATHQPKPKNAITFESLVKLLEKKSTKNRRTLNFATRTIEKPRMQPLPHQQHRFP
jgi:hypothetical protein